MQTCLECRGDISIHIYLDGHAGRAGAPVRKEQSNVQESFAMRLEIFNAANDAIVLWELDLC